jgi:dolichol-phosphate mannosyltransferase
VKNLADKILVFIPCYNCEPQVARVLHQFNEKNAGYFSEILLLDNGSKDNTVSVAIETVKLIKQIPVTVGKNLANYNLGGSHKVAFQYARENQFTHVVVLHGDDQGSILDLLPVLDKGQHRSYDACLGARFMPGAKLAGYSNFRIIGNKVFNFIFTLGTNKSVKDLGSGLNIFGKKVFEDQRIGKYADDLRFNIYLLLGLFDNKFKVQYFPISWREDDQVSNVKMTSQALKTLQLLWQSILDKKEFWAKDHRDFIHKTYKFEVVYKS